MSKLSRIEVLFRGRHFDGEVIILCVRWYLRFKLSFRDLVEMMAERGLHLAYTTILRWVQRYVPKFVNRWNRFGHPAGRSWRVGEPNPPERTSRTHWKTFSSCSPQDIPAPERNASVILGTVASVPRANSNVSAFFETTKFFRFEAL